MTDRLLDALMDAEMINKLGGQDSRIEKIEQACDALAEQLAAKPPMLIGATLAGLDATVPSDDPALSAARASLKAAWRTYQSIFTDDPRELLRWMLLDACQQASADDPMRAAIVWLTAADRLPFARLGRAEGPVRAWLAQAAEATERRALVRAEAPALGELPSLPQLKPASTEVPASKETDRQSIRRRVGNASGPQLQGQRQRVPGANPHWPNQANHWSWEFAPRMADLLADELDALRAELHQHGQAIHDGVSASQKKFSQALTKAFNAQQRWLQDTQSAVREQQVSGDSRLDALWWAEARYSTSLRCSYRRLPPAAAAVVMARDLVDLMPSPAAASVGFLLAEAVAVLPSAGFEVSAPIAHWLGEIAETREQIPKSWRARRPGREPGRCAFPELVYQGLRGANREALLKRAGLTPDDAISLPDLAHAIFRQSQARRIAEALT